MALVSLVVKSPRRVSRTGKFPVAFAGREHPSLRARANGMNRLAILIPCHRVINSGGALGGYGGDLWRKQRPLALERGERLLVP